VNVRSAALGQRHLHLPKLFGCISGARVAKRSSKRLTLVLDKVDKNKTWDALMG